MGSLEVIFGTIVLVLAALAVIGALAYVIVWAVCGIRRTLANYDTRPRFDPSTRYWPEHSAVNVVESIVPPPAP
jgi:hypothetical protein